MAEVKSYKVIALPQRPTPDSIYWVKASVASEVEGYITDRQGIPYPLKDLQGSGGITTLINTDGNLVITGVNSKTINIAPALLSLINSALQSGTSISELVNDTGYITALDLPTKTSDLTNDGANNSSTYIETDELGAVAFSNDYGDLDNLPTIPTVPSFADQTETNEEYASIKIASKETGINYSTLRAIFQGVLKNKTNLILKNEKNLPK